VLGDEPPVDERPVLGTAPLDVLMTVNGVGTKTAQMIHDMMSRKRPRDWTEWERATKTTKGIGSGMVKRFREHFNARYAP
jgi:hypothetical protein